MKLSSSRDAMFKFLASTRSHGRLSTVKTLHDYEKLQVSNGGRLVIGFLPVCTPLRASPKSAVEELWGIKFQYCPVLNDYSSKATRPCPARPRCSSNPAPTGAQWARIPTVRSLPVTAWPTQPAADAIEKSFWQRRPSFCWPKRQHQLSNEGLRDERDAEMIASLAGPAQRITFDENHFGVVETGSVTKLMRRYRLQGAVAILIVAAALFLWRSGGPSLLPPRESGDVLSTTGRDRRAVLDGWTWQLCCIAASPKNNCWIRLPR